MDRSTVLWALVAFFGAGVAFGTIRTLTEEQPVAVTLLLQVAALVVIVAAIVVIVRRGDKGE